jgi:UDP-glucuronate 4-epimerase
MLKKMKTVLVTGSVGFIGFHLVKELLTNNFKVIGIDNINDYYSLKHKKLRIDDLASFIKKNNHKDNYSFYKIDIANRENVLNLFDSHPIDIVINLAAQAGVRYSIDDPFAYVDSNLVGFVNILEGCRHSNIKHHIFASSSSVYGMNKKQPFSTKDNTDYPISLYAASKKSNELLAHSYSHLFDIPTTGLRFFTVYGTHGRPDMAYFKFTEAIITGKPIDVYNHGKMKRDFTYVDDIVKAICLIADSIPKQKLSEITKSTAKFKVYNIGNNKPVTLKRFIAAIEKSSQKKAIQNYLPMQPGDVPITYADIEDLQNDFNFTPSTSIEDGIDIFVKWYLENKISI